MNISTQPALPTNVTLKTALDALAMVVTGINGHVSYLHRQFIAPREQACGEPGKPPVQPVIYDVISELVGLLHGIDARLVEIGEHIGM